MVDVILLLRPDYVALLGGRGARYVHLDVLRPDHFRQVLEGVQHLIPKVELYELEVLEAHAALTLLVAHLRHVPLLLLDDLEASLPHLLFKVEVVEHGLVQEPLPRLVIGEHFFDEQRHHVLMRVLLIAELIQDHVLHCLIWSTLGGATR